MTPRTCELYMIDPALNVDKVYLVHLKPAPLPAGTWVVNVEWGRRGAKLQSDGKTRGGVSYSEATLIYWRTIEKQRRKGYKQFEPRAPMPPPITQPVTLPIGAWAMSDRELNFVLAARSADKNEGWIRDWLNYERFGSGRLPDPVTAATPRAGSNPSSGRERAQPRIRELERAEARRAWLAANPDSPDSPGYDFAADQEQIRMLQTRSAQARLNQLNSQAARTVPPPSPVPVTPPVPNLKPKRKISFD